MLKIFNEIYILLTSFVKNISLNKNVIISKHAKRFLNLLLKDYIILSYIAIELNVFSYFLTSLMLKIF